MKFNLLSKLNPGSYRGQTVNHAGAKAFALIL